NGEKQINVPGLGSEMEHCIMITSAVNQHRKEGCWCRRTAYPAGELDKIGSSLTHKTSQHVTSEAVWTNILLDASWAQQLQRMICSSGIWQSRTEKPFCLLFSDSLIQQSVQKLTISEDGDLKASGGGFGL
ncbi:mCG145928, partial [Mus musculus]